MDLDKRLNLVDYGFFDTDYRPTQFALEFIAFVKLVNGSMGEENKSPIIHYDMLDQLSEEREAEATRFIQNLYVSFRGSAKTTALHEYMYLYLATYGGIKGLGQINVAMYISDTMENGVKSMRNNLEFRWNNSEFLQKYVPFAKFTDVRWEFNNADGKRLTIRGFGATTGVRGFKEYGERPTWCHSVGTEVTTNEGTHLVEEYSNAILKEDSGFDVSITGLPGTERVTEDHQYWCKTTEKKRNKKYILGGKTLSNTVCKDLGNGWVHAKDLSLSSSVENQTYRTHWIGEPIDTTVQSVPYDHKHSNLPEWWWLYGLWLSDGFRSSRHLSWCVAYTEEHTVGAKILNHLTKLGYGYYRKEGKGCYTLTVSDAKWSRLLAKHKRGNSIKDLPEWALTIDILYQRELLEGYIAGDGYVTPKQTRINSVNPVILKQLGKICGRLGIAYTIRNTKKSGVEKFPDGYMCNVQAQQELRFSTADQDAAKVGVFIDNGFIWRRFSKKIAVEKAVFVPITTPDHTYTTEFGLSHNCGMDDLMSDKNAESPTIIRDIKNIVYKAARQAMHPKKRIVIWTGTPFNKSDPFYEAASSKAWNVRVYPICEKFPCSKSEFKGAWEDRFPYSFVKNEYYSLLESGEISSFNQELMLRITSEESRLILDSDLIWYNRDLVVKNRSKFNFYITTDFATSDGKKSDFSVCGVWAYTNNGEWLLVDGFCKRQLMDKNIDQLFRYVAIYKPLSVGIEINGQQKGFIQWLKSEMINRNIFFNFARQGSVEGIRRTGKKIASFKLFVPQIKAKKVWLALEMKTDPLVTEILEEMSFVTDEGFQSKNDDAADMMSMLTEMDPYKPGEAVEVSYTEDEDGNYGMFVDDEEEDLYNSSTIF